MSEYVRGDKPLAIAIMGPTASGKTDLVLSLSHVHPIHVISVDSALVYRDMNIGTAKPSPSELQLTPHALIDIRDPSEPYSAAEFCRDAKREMSIALAGGKIPVLVGGTMLYFKALLDGLSPMPPSCSETRAAIEQEAAERGWPHLHQQLLDVDPALAKTIHPNHSQRICRALEIYRSTGKTMSDWRQSLEGGVLNDYRWVQVAVAPRDRSVLHQRIAKRFDVMMNLGFVDEVRSLHSRGDLSVDMPSVRAVGYRQCWDFISGLSTEADMVEAALAATRQLAKRQLTWLRSWPELNWIYTQSSGGVELSKEEILSKLLKLLD